MKNFLLTALFFVFATHLFAQEKSEAIDFEQITTYDNANKVYVDLKAKAPEYVVILEKDYIVSSDRVKAINKRFTEEENNSGRIITVQYNGLKDFSTQWTALVKLLINDPNVLKLREWEEGSFQMLVSESFEQKTLERIADKAKWPISLSE